MPTGAPQKTSGATWMLPRVRKRLLALLLRIVGRCPWCLTKFTAKSQLLNLVLLRLQCLNYGLNVVVHETHIFSPTFLADFLFAYDRASVRYRYTPPWCGL
jgi:hypothetical protein